MDAIRRRELAIEAHRADRDRSRGLHLLALLAGLLLLSALVLALASGPARGAPAPASTLAAPAPALHLRAHITPDTLAAWQAARVTTPTAQPSPLLDCQEVSDDPAAAPRDVDPATVVSGEWSQAWTDMTDDGERPAVVADKYTLRAQ